VNRRVTLLVWFAGWPLRQALLVPIRLYRVALGALFGGNCRFYPSCSAYAELAISRAGAIRGLALTAWRVARCSPLSAGGIDNPPVSAAWRMLHPNAASDQVPEAATGVAA
jgi:putative membrane protein insertion efficiency factor